MLRRRRCSLGPLPRAASLDLLIVLSPFASPRYALVFHVAGHDDAHALHEIQFGKRGQTEGDKDGNPRERAEHTVNLSEHSGDNTWRGPGGPIHRSASEHAFHGPDNRADGDVRDQAIVNPMPRESNDQVEVLHAPDHSGG